MLKMEVAMAMLCQIDKYHLQLRDGDKKIGAVGMIGFFGGKVESGEEPRTTISRELAEETNLKLSAESFRYLDSVLVLSDYKLKPVQVKAKVFEVLLPFGIVVEAKEGQLVTWTQEEILENLNQLTPATNAFFEGYF